MVTLLPLLDKVGSGTLIANELVVGLLTFTSPLGVIVVVGLTGTVTVLSAVPYVILKLFPTRRSSDLGTLMLYEFVPRVEVAAIPDETKEVFGVTGIVAVLITVP